ncbi:glycosyltransferase [Leuconostoc lactis]|uniref:glycosyltransferase n=1 Tax=Leuconostoc lactis TaxID=1246 RepID=UPI000219538F|nr:glycosyltransferase [Leuconostoc lactis]GHC21657.1 glycosyl transferase family 2 [Leuconostoc lactis KCTC 3528 = DSM 20202]
METLVKNETVPRVSLAVCLIIYNVTVDKSESLIAIRNQIDSNQIYVFDNSSNEDISFENRNTSKVMGINYIKTDNLGLGKTYNDAVKVVKKQYDFIVFFDQDTEIPNNFISVLSSKLNSESQIIVPEVNADEKKISPISRKKRLFNFDKIPEFSAINSGMCVSKKIFETIRFDEDLFLDYVDHDFFNKVSLNKITIETIPVVLLQNFSDNEYNITKASKRFETYLNDSKIYSKIYGSSVYLSVFRHALKLSLRYRSLLFFKRMISNEEH